MIAQLLSEGIEISPNIQAALEFGGQLALDIAAEVSPTDDTPHRLTVSEALEIAGKRLRAGK